MRILVCAKQVPDTNEIKIDPIKNTLIRRGVPSIMNPYDECALEQALQLKDISKDVHITVVSMGPKQVENMLRDALSVGADKVYLVTDRVFGGSDTLATSYILSEAIKLLEEKDGKFDLIFCGKQAIDGDTAQVGPEIAAKLDLPQITYATKIKIKENKINVERELDELSFVVESELPALVTFTKTDDLRFATMKYKIRAKKADINLISFEDIENIDSKRIGIKGSPTRVSKTYTPNKQKESIIFNMSEDKMSISKILDVLKDNNLV